ncbi:plasmid mobilization relaxosome protein MobC [Campylobacter jejuni]|nr:plasmid mobilization relaxosome protein MobC [Campylobacter jejuni]
MKKQMTIYFNEEELEQLDYLAKQLSITKSAVLRKLLTTEPYLKVVDSIETFNYITIDFVREINHIGININQIQKYINMNIQTLDENTANLYKSINKLQKIIQEHKELTMNTFNKLKNIKIRIKKTKVNSEK